MSATTPTPVFTQQEWIMGVRRHHGHPITPVQNWRAPTYAQMAEKLMELGLYWDGRRWWSNAAGGKG